jgi:hypothetical protein
MARACSWPNNLSVASPSSCAPTVVSNGELVRTFDGFPEATLVAATSWRPGDAA